ncbi:hypothetical protein ACFQZS_02840 [Mucilaginibacter calamicampi]|uniref:MG2 domain-containing protein n=1 Tax=Mucilaginibacter calamicampi TaxID=1302352 RepID=A0ABW2YRM4_9SPHI
MTRMNPYLLSKRMLALAFLIIAGISANAQSLTELKANVENYKKQVLKEKLYVHVNKDFYLTGEILWFKVYNVEGASHIPLDLSKVAYLELLDSKHAPVLQTKVTLKNGQGAGSIYLPASVGAGNYVLRAYTAWMKNFDADSYFEKAITVVNLSQEPEKAQLAAADFDVQFMPEGGNLVEGLNSKVAVKVSDNRSRGVNYKGAIVDQSNDTVARFSPLKMGIGAFSFTPTTGKTYKAVVKVGSRVVTKSLPAISAGGYVMQAEDKGASWDVTVNSKNNNPSEHLYLLLHNSANVQAATELTLTNNSGRYTIEKSKLADGVNQLTVFNAQRQPVAERLIFKRPGKQLKIDAKTDAASYDKRQKVSLDVSTLDETAKAQASSLSVSVYRLDSLQRADEAGINSFVWLSADVKGLVESPDYYFKDDSKETNQAIDNLLLAQGWRAFNWTEATSAKKPSFQFAPEYDGQLVSGTISNRTTGRPAPNTLTYISFPGTKARLFSARSDAQGRFFFNSGFVYGANEVVLQVNHFIDSTTYKIDLASPFSDKFSTTSLPAFNVSPVQKPLLSEHSLSMQVQNTYQLAGMRQFYSTDTDSTSFYGTPAKSFVLDQFTRFTTMEEVMREFVSYIFLVRKDKKLYLKAFNQRGVFNDEPLVMVDGVPVFDNNKIFEVDPLKVKKVDVLPERVFKGDAVFEGLVNLTTYKGDMNSFELNPKAVLLDYEGLQLQRQFYSPVYNSGDEKASRLPDFRNALYWNPDLSTAQDGKVNTSYFTSDIPGKYIGILQGMGNNGRSGSAYFSFEVK